MVERSQRTAAKVIAITYLLTLVTITGVFMKAYAPLLAWNNVAQTARNLVAHETSVRIYVAGASIYGLGLILLVAAFYVVFRPVSRGLALFAASARLLYAFLWFMGILCLVSALHVMRTGAFDSDRLSILAGLQLAAGKDAYYVGLTFYGIGSVVFGYLWLRSRYVPKSLAVFGIATSIFEGGCAFAYFLTPAFGKIISENWYEAPTVLFETALSVWLLVKGLRPPEQMNNVAAERSRLSR